MHRRLSLALLLWSAGLSVADPRDFHVAMERALDAEAQTWRAVDDTYVFGPGDRVRFRISGTSSGYLYVVNHGTSGTFELLFPRIETQTENQIAAGKEYIVPNGPGVFRVTGPPGRDTIYWLMSPVQLDRDSILPASREPSTAMRSRCDDSILKSRGECNDAHASTAPGFPAPVIYELQLSHR